MMLSPCRSCGREVSLAAASCPACGDRAPHAPVPRETKTGLLLNLSGSVASLGCLVIFLVFLVAVMFAISPVLGVIILVAMGAMIANKVMSSRRSP